MQADGKKLVLVSRVGVCCWAVFMGALMCVAQVANINVNWLITIIGALPWSVFAFVPFVALACPLAPEINLPYMLVLLCAAPEILQTCKAIQPQPSPLVWDM